jgi:hypothetical protein
MYTLSRCLGGGDKIYDNVSGGWGWGEGDGG